MSDFMPWLYAHYFQPQINAAPQGDYSFWLDLLRNQTAPSGQPELEKALEFFSIQAFLLGLRTGEGLALSRPERPRSFPASEGSRPL